ncbi:hypothetical protein [Tardiphaga robiniae]|uniref:hypothetical protein n=1 Tax=Tardiphaga robiniae TaxID=943830 RepID=UPI001586A6AB|nr:hypothetical protein [Tardiphaga robiniae]NUU41371.1 hypothetical protein [Tardiphaga robiniae]
MSIIVQRRRDTRTNCQAGTPADGELWWDQTLKALRMGDGATLGGYLHKRWGYSYPLIPAQITANQNDYNPTDLSIAETILLNSDAARTITGIAGGAFGRNIKLINRGSFEITLANSSASSTAANRFLFEADIVMRPNAAVEIQYSTTDSRWMRTSGGVKFATIPQELLLTGVISPAQITANTNDYAPTSVALATTLRLSTDASRNLTGLVDPRDGAMKMIINVGSNPLVLKNADAGSTAANRFDFGNDVTLAGKQAALLRYDGTDARWKLVSSTAGAAVAAGAVTAQTLAPSALGARVGMINGTFVESRVGGAATYAVKTLAGTDPTSADPVFFVFNTGGGGYVIRAVTAALSIVISSGSSAGAINSVAFHLWLVAFDDAGTVRLGFKNCWTGTVLSGLNEAFPASSTAEGGAGGADNAGTFYTGTAVASKYYCIIGVASYEAGLAAVGTWGIAPSWMQLYGPGVPKPGEPVGEVTQMLTSTTTSTTATSYQNTGVTVSPTLKSAANIAKVSWWGGLSGANSSAAVYAGLHRGATQIGPEYIEFLNVASASLVGPLSGEWLDAPNTTTPAYMIKIKAQATNTTRFPENTSGGNGGMKVEELMS